MTSLVKTIKSLSVQCRQQYRQCRGQSKDSFAVFRLLFLLAAIFVGGNQLDFTPEVNSQIVQPCPPLTVSRWRTPTQLGDTLGSQASPHVAVSSNGDAIAVWSRQNGTTYDVYASRYTWPSGSLFPIWEPATVVGTSQANFDPRVAMDSSGNAILVWEGREGNRTNIYANRFTPGGGWGTPTTIENNNYNAHSPQIAMDSLGNAIAVWEQNGNIYMNRFNSFIGGWSISPTLLESSQFAASAPRIKMSSQNGHAIATWLFRPRTGLNDLIRA